MIHLSVLKTREVKKIIGFIEDRFDVKIDLNYVFFKNNKDRIYIVNREINKIDMRDLKVDTLGFYFCSEEKDGYRLSFDGAMMINARKNVVEVSNENKNLWMRGEDIPVEHEDGYVIVKNGEDFLGCGKVKEGMLLNFVPKSRRQR